ncbi:MAG: PorP/SprF family type IX secretion system membrane protein [Flavobacteriales bacterium]|nr:PorP/SprF family type IX secretion system membrane protein [Flavobacteriales bacterium]
MKKQALLLLSLIFGLHVISLGQDIHLSQYYMQDQLLNPGAVGNFIGDFRVAGSYREQWKQISAGKDPISSYMLGYEMPVNVRSQKLDLGIIVTQDNMADLDIASNKILFSTAYKLSLGASDVRVGIQFGPILRRSSFDSYSYPSQWAYYPNAFDTENRSSGETSLNNSSGYFDVNAGAVWLKQYSRMHIEGGMALNHVNRPKDTHFDGFTERLRMRKTAHLFVNYRLTPNLYIEPKAMLTWTANANELLLGGNVKLKSPLDFIPWIYFGTITDMELKEILMPFTLYLV